MSTDLITLIPIFFIIALLYSSAGFGGGSSYLAVLALSTIPFTQFRMIALLCNIAVVMGSVWVFYRAGHMQVRRILPLVLLSIPFAYLGGRLSISEEYFFPLLGITLLIAGLMMFNSKESSSRKLLPLYGNSIIGGSIGFLSGVVGIGGGIFLSPVLTLSRWADAKIIAATTALFILVNSIAGLIGQIVTNGFDVGIETVLLLLLPVILGGQIGSRYSAIRLEPKIVRKIAALLIIAVALRLLYNSIPTMIA